MECWKNPRRGVIRRGRGSCFGPVRALYLLPRAGTLQSSPQRDLSTAEGRGQNHRVARWDRLLSPPPMGQVGPFLYLPHARGAGARFQAEGLCGASRALLGCRTFPRLELLRGLGSVAGSFAVAPPAGRKVSGAECERLRAPGRSVQSSEAQPRDCPASDLVSFLSSRSRQKVCRRPRKPYFLMVRSGEGADPRMGPYRELATLFAALAGAPEKGETGLRCSDYGRPPRNYTVNNKKGIERRPSTTKSFPSPKY